MKIEAKIVADSRNSFGNRITTMVLTYPRIIHSEFMTHRMFSRNASSSRAVPAEKTIQSVLDTPFIPLAWQRQHKGMQGTEYITNQEEINLEIQDWLEDRDYAVKKARKRLERGLTKQLINRPLECFQYYTTIVTATEWENFFALRCPKYKYEHSNGANPTYFRSKKDFTNSYNGACSLNGLPRATEDEIDSIYPWNLRNKGQAEIHMMALAEAMWDALNESTPKKLQEGDWHIPFGDDIDYTELGRASSEYYRQNPSEIVDPNKWALKISTVRCARTSYTVVGEDQKPLTYERMFEIYDNLITANPKHMSPFEHCAQAMGETNRWYYTSQQGKGTTDLDANLGWSGNFKGFIQYRKLIPNENITK